jgi:hypothetical protein
MWLITIALVYGLLPNRHSSSSCGKMQKLFYLKLLNYFAVNPKFYIFAHPK